MEDARARILLARAPVYLDKPVVNLITRLPLIAPIVERRQKGIYLCLDKL